MVFFENEEDYRTILTRAINLKSNADISNFLFNDKNELNTRSLTEIIQAELLINSLYGKKFNLTGSKKEQQMDDILFFKMNCIVNENKEKEKPEEYEVFLSSIFKATDILSLKFLSDFEQGKSFSKSNKIPLSIFEDYDCNSNTLDFVLNRKTIPLPKIKGKNIEEVKKAFVKELATFHHYQYKYRDMNNHFHPPVISAITTLDILDYIKPEAKENDFYRLHRLTESQDLFCLYKTKDGKFYNGSKHLIHDFITDRADEKIVEDIVSDLENEFSTIKAYNLLPLVELFKEQFLEKTQDAFTFDFDNFKVKINPFDALIQSDNFNLKPFIRDVAIKLFKEKPEIKSELELSSFTGKLDKEDLTSITNKDFDYISFKDPKKLERILLALSNTEETKKVLIDKGVCLLGNKENKAS